MKYLPLLVFTIFILLSKTNAVIQANTFRRGFGTTVTSSCCFSIGQSLISLDNIYCPLPVSPEGTYGLRFVRLSVCHTFLDPAITLLVEHIVLHEA